VCLNSAPVFLNATNILVFVNPNWVPVTSTGGTGYFSGIGVGGNYFYPTTLGIHVITYTYTDPNGCTATITNTINVIDCPPPCSCDTDTVCITVRPAPVLIWPLSYADVCLNGAPVFLNANNIFVLVNNSWVSVPASGGSGYFGGPGVVGNLFYPTTLGINTITYYYTDAYGCTGTVTITINVINCGCDPTSCNCYDLPPPPGATITIVSVDPDDCRR